MADTVITQELFVIFCLRAGKGDGDAVRDDSFKCVIQWMGSMHNWPKLHSTGRNLASKLTLIYNRSAFQTVDLMHETLTYPHNAEGSPEKQND